MTSIAIPRRLAGAGQNQRFLTFVRGRAEDAPWVRPAVLGLVALAALVNVANLTLNGLANTYYAAAALAGSQSWSAWFFGSVDAGNFITIDKPPLSTMVMGLSVRLFGLNSLSILLPQAFMGVATVLVLYLAVRRSFGPVAGLLAGLVMALTPVAALMFRFDNPDALLTMLLVFAAYAFVRALEGGRLRWLIVAAALVGLGFNTKYLQAYLVLPAFIFTWTLAGPRGLRRRLAGLVVAAVSLLVASGWWVLAVELVPASARPFIGGSTSNSAFDLIFGYDGLARIFGGAGAGTGGFGGGSPTFAGSAGLLRLFNTELGGQIAWLLPFSLVALVAGLGMRLRARRTDPALSGYLIWGLWLAVTGLVFSFMSGTIHAYYAVALAPAIAALVGAGVVDLWSLRSRFRFGGAGLAVAIVATAWVGWQLLDRAPAFVPGLGIAAFAAATLCAFVVAVPATDRLRRVQLLAAGLAMAAMLAGPAAYTMETMTTAKSGEDPSAGPNVAGLDAGRGNGGPGGMVAQADGVRPALPAGLAAADGTLPAPGGAAGVAGEPGGATVDSSLLSYLVVNRGTATWIVAVDSAMQAASIELATGEPVMGMGGFTGSDPAPTLEQLKAYVASGQLRYVIVGGSGGGPDGSSSRSAIEAWVTSAGTAVDYGGTGGTTLYDLSGAAPAAA
jgi:4-amino-4-deoxy-L-arabinose transferase-like glycosyltransferase